MVRRTKEQARDTRGRILDAAEAMFQKQGVSRTSLQAIASASGYTRGAIYWHFRNKSELFEALMERVELPLEAGLQRQAAAGADPLAMVRGALMAIFDAMVDDARTRRTIEIALFKVEYVDEMRSARDRHAAVKQHCMARIERELRRANEQGLIDAAVPPALGALGLCALTDGLLQQWLLDAQGFDLRSVGGQLVDLALAAMQLPSGHGAPTAPDAPQPIAA